VNDLNKLGNFLKENAIDSLIYDSLMLAEGGPTDSESLSWIFHLHGVNMRYLGEVLKRFTNECNLKNLKFKHIEFLLEKEILIRSLKHTFITYLNEAKLEN
jgi:protein TIF31